MRPSVRPLRIYYTLRRRGGNRERERAKVPRVSSHLNLRLRLWPPSLGRKRGGGVLTLLNSSHNFTPISPGQCLPPLSLFIDRGLLLGLFWHFLDLKALYVLSQECHCVTSATLQPTQHCIITVYGWHAVRRAEGPSATAVDHKRR